jgi:hypothetical protein
MSEQETEGLVERLLVESNKNGGQGAYAWRARKLCGEAAAAIQSLQSMLAQFVAWADGSDDKPHSLTEDARKLLRKLDGGTDIKKPS